MQRDLRDFIADVVDEIAEVVAERNLQIKRYLPQRSVREQLKNDEFFHAVSALEARTAIELAIEAEVGAIWDRTRKSREAAIENVAVSAVPLLLVVSGMVFALIRSVAWISANWPSSEHGVWNFITAFFQEALRDWRNLGNPDRWIFLAGAIALLTIARKIVIATATDIPIVVNALGEEIDAEVVPLIRVELNKIANQKYKLSLPVVSAPGLGEVSSPQRLVLRYELEQVRVWGEELGAPAIAISGTRGVGKTTLLRSLVDPNYDARMKDRPLILPVFVAAPVTYDAREFLILLYSELCRQVLFRLGGWRSRKLPMFVRRATRRLLRLVRVIVGLALLGATSLAVIATRSDQVEAWMQARSWPTLHSLWAAAFLIAATSAIWATIKTVLPFTVGVFYVPPVIAERAALELSQLKYAQTLSVEASGGVKKFGLEVGGKRLRQLAERPLTMPELVASYREFAGEVGAWLNDLNGSRLLVCIDEVDRIAKAEDAESFINEVKSIFGIKYCRYLVTVSEDALAGFERRVVGVRPTLDNAFDEVLRLEPFTASQSLELLQRHVVGFPDIFILLCHCLGGGLPRDVVREARALLDENRRLRSPEKEDLQWAKSGLAPNVEKLATLVVDRDIRSLKRGLLNKMHNLHHQDLPIGVQSRLADKNWPGDSTAQALLMLQDLLDIQDAHSELRLEAASAIYFYVTVRDSFTERVNVIRKWVKDIPRRSGVRKAGADDLIEDLARIRSLLQSSSTVALREINRIRKELGLPVLDVSRYL